MYPLHTALVIGLIICTCYRINYRQIKSTQRVSDLSPLAYLRERTCELDTARFVSWVWPMVLRKLGNRWKWKGEAWFHYTKVLFVGVIGIADMW